MQKYGVELDSLTLGYATVVTPTITSTRKHPFALMCFFYKEILLYLNSLGREIQCRNVFVSCWYPWFVNVIRAFDSSLFNFFNIYILAPTILSGLLNACEITSDPMRTNILWYIEYLIDVCHTIAQSCLHLWFWTTSTECVSERTSPTIVLVIPVF